MTQLKSSMIVVLDLANFAFDATVATDDHCRVVAWSPNAEQLLSYAQSEATGRHCVEVLQAVSLGDNAHELIGNRGKVIAGRG